MHKISLLTILILFSIWSIGQNKNEIKNTQSLDELFKIADYYNKPGKKKDSLLFYLKTIEKDAKIGLDSTKLARLNNLWADAYYSKSNFNKTIEHGEKALSFYTKNKKTKLAALVKTKIGSAYQGLHKGKEAIKYLKEAESDLSGDDLVLVYLGLGNTYSQLNDLENSISYLTKAQEQAEKRKKPGGVIGIIYNSIAIVYIRNKEIKKATLYLEKTIKIAKKNDNALNQTLALYNIGWITLDNNDYKKSLPYFNKAYALLDEIDHVYLKAMTHQGYAKALLYSGDLERATQLINEAHSLYKSINNKNRIPYIYNIQAAIANKKGNTDQAIALLKESIELSKENEIVGIVKQNYLDLSKAYKTIGKPLQALEIYEKYVAINDSIINRQKIKETEALKIKFEVHEMEKNIKLKDQELVILESKKKASNYRNIILAVLGIGLLIFIYRQRKFNLIHKRALNVENELISLKKTQLENKMTFKENKITEYAIHINQRNDFLESCKTQLKDIQKSSIDKETVDKVKKLQFFIKSHIEVQKDDIEFNADTKEKASDFEYKLKQQFPTLTEKEILVCTHLLLNLSSKKIAEKMNITYLSVNNYRTSIRKKTKLPKGGNLKRFLNSLN